MASSGTSLIQAAQSSARYERNAPAGSVNSSLDSAIVLTGEPVGFRPVRTLSPIGSGQIAAAFPTYVGPDPTPGFRALDRFLGQKHEDGTAHRAKESRPQHSGTTAADLVRQNLAAIGTPAEVARQLAAIEATGVTDYFAIPDFCALEPDRVISSPRVPANLATLQSR
ncbi:MAG: hypothetical protein WAK40_00350 [Thermoplasmata archaeon]